jgi:hypothetical protein
MQNNKTGVPLGRITISASNALNAFRFVNCSGSECSDSERILGVTDRSYAAGELANIIISGIVVVEANAAIANLGSNIGPAAGGKAATSSSNTGIINLDASTASGDFIRVRL